MTVEINQRCDDSSHITPLRGLRELSDVILSSCALAVEPQEDHPDPALKYPLHLCTAASTEMLPLDQIFSRRLLGRLWGTLQFSTTTS